MFQAFFIFLFIENILNFMNFPVTFFLNGGLFDFDLTFIGEASLFFVFSLIVTFVFLSPVSKQLDDRAEFIDTNLRKSTLLVTYGYKKLSTCVKLLTQEVNELNRQVKLVKTYTFATFEDEVNSVQKENSLLLSALKGELSIKSAYLFSNIITQLTTITDNFFTKKFQSI
jgi:hypothetical protein